MDIYDVNSLRRAVNFIRTFNREDLSDILFVEGDEYFTIDKDVLVEFSLMGLLNIDIITSDFYKQRPTKTIK